MTEEYKQALQELPLSIRSIFIQPGNDYLQVVENAGYSYLGKYLGDTIDFPSLEMVHQHVISILKRLVPACPYSSNSLILLALPSHKF